MSIAHPQCLYVYGSAVLLGLGAMCGEVAFQPINAATPDPEIAGYISVEGGRVWYRINGTEHFAEGKIPLS